MLDRLGAFLQFALVFALMAWVTACSRLPSPLTPQFRGTVGLPHQGLLTDGVMLPREGHGHRWFNPAGNHYGTRELVDLVQSSAAKVREQYPNSRSLLVGDLSARKGGKLRNHASHRTGRDVDLLFYMTTLTGQPIESAGFVRFGPDGLGMAGTKRGEVPVQFDVERNWALVKSLLQAEGPGVIWLFVARPLEALLTEYALARGEDLAVVWHAESVMLQPRNALPHDDHFHLRIGCTAEQAVCGCEDNGPHWPWLPAPPSLRLETEDDLYAAIDVDSLPPLSSTAGDTRSRSPKP